MPGSWVWGCCFLKRPQGGSTYACPALRTGETWALANAVPGREMLVERAEQAQRARVSFLLPLALLPPDLSYPLPKSYAEAAALGRWSLSRETGWK